MIFFVMRFAILLLIIILLGLAVRQVSSEFRYRNKSRAVNLTTDTRGRRLAVPHQRVPDTDLVARAVELRRAIDAGDITLDEAIGSLCRFGGAAISPERAKNLLTTE